MGGVIPPVLKVGGPIPPIPRLRRLWWCVTALWISHSLTFHGSCGEAARLILRSYICNSWKHFTFCCCWQQKISNRSKPILSHPLQRHKISRLYCTVFALRMVIRDAQILEFWVHILYVPVILCLQSRPCPSRVLNLHLSKKLAVMHSVLDSSTSVHLWCLQYIKRSLLTEPLLNGHGSDTLCMVSNFVATYGDQDHWQGDRWTGGDAVWSANGGVRIASVSCRRVSQEAVNMWTQQCVDKTKNTDRGW